MKSTALSIQLHPDRSKQLDLTDAIERLSDLAPGAEVDDGVDHRRYVNINYNATSVASLWRLIQAELNDDPELARCAIVCCEGKSGRDDYLLLHHYDPKEKLDKLS